MHASKSNLAEWCENDDQLKRHRGQHFVIEQDSNCTPMMILFR